MKRSEQLKPLSHEHHHALFIAKRLRDEGEEAITAFAEFWRSEGELHFRIEEEVLLPGSGLGGPGEDADVARMLQLRIVTSWTAYVVDMQTRLGRPLPDIEVA